MTTINQLTALDTLELGDQIAVFDQSMGDARRASMYVLLDYIQRNLVIPTTESTNLYTTQYASPSATGFIVTITDGALDNTNVHLILTPTAGYAAGTIKLPLVTSVVDKQEVLVNTTQQITSLTVNGNGAVAVTGAPTSLGADDYFRLKYDVITQSWYRVG